MSDSSQPRPPPNGLAPDGQDPAEKLLQLWLLGQRPDVGDFLAQAGEVTPAQVLAVLQVDQRQRWEGGERAPAETYLHCYPALRADGEHALDIVYGEFLLREELGESPALDEYLRRFPECGEQLKLQVNLHRAIESRPPAAPGRGSPPRLESGKAAPAGPAVAGYEVLRQLGRGGMGVVWQVRQKGLNRLVALKMALAGEDANPEQLTRFRAEAETAALLRHPNIVQIYEVGEHAGRPYFTMEFLDGGSLAERLGAMPQPAGEAAELVETLARAMHYAHQHGVIHRDLKPANVLLQCKTTTDHTDSTDKKTPQASSSVASVLSVVDFTPKITDFGLAKHLVAGALQTESGVVLGTASYMAPEQAAGHTREVGPAVDVHALGAMLYELLTGRPPFRAATLLETLDLVRSADPVAPRRLRPKLPRDLETICLKCLHKEPHKRYASAQDLADDLRRFRCRQPIKARRTGTAGRAWRWCRRNPAVAALVGSIAVLLVLTAVGASLAAVRLGQERNTAVGNQDRAERAERDGQEKLLAVTYSQAQAFRRSGRMGQRFESLKALQDAARLSRALSLEEKYTPELRNEAIACLALTDLHVLQEWEEPAACAFPVVFDAKLERYACPDQQGNVSIYQVAGHRKIAHLPGPGENVDSLRLQFSTDGRFLGVTCWHAGGPWRLVLWDLLGAGPRRQFGPADRGACTIRADGRQLAVGEHDGSIALHDLVHGGQRSVGPDSHVGFMAFGPDGRQLAVVSYLRRQEVRVLDLGTDQVVSRLPHPDDVNALAWSADGRLLAAACDDRNVYVWDVPGRRQQAVLEGHQKGVTAVAFSPAGDLLASSGGDRTTRLWDPVSGRQLVSAPGMCLGFGPDGRRLAFRDGPRLGIWEVADGRECRVLHHGRVGNRAPDTDRALFHTGPKSLDLSPDGRLLVSAGVDGVRLWDVPTSQEIAYLSIGHHEAAFFHPGGDRFYTFGRTGLRCWPLRSDRRGLSEVLRVGPPRVLDVPAGWDWSYRACCSGDGRWIAVNDRDHDRVLVLNEKRPADRVLVEKCSNIDTLALSRDGLWLAAGLVRPDPGTRVWDVRNGRQVWRSPVDLTCVAFSPDGQWLLTGGEADYRLWRVESWEPGPVFPRDRPEGWHGPVAFSRDGRLVAVARTAQHVQLIDLASMEAMATLTGPGLPYLQGLCLSADGRLLAAATEENTIQLWDLRAVRRQLGPMGLDWDQPPYPAPEPAARPAPRVVVR